MNRIRYIIVGLFCLLLSLNSFSQNAEKQKFSLKEAQEYAVQNSYKTQSSALDVEIAKKQVKQYTSIGLPQISASGRYMDYVDIPTQMLPLGDFGFPGLTGDRPVKFGSKYNLTGSIDGSQLIFDGKYIVGLKTAKVYVEMTRTSQLKSQQEIRETVTQAYYLVLVARENRKVLDSTVSNIRTTAKQTNAYHQNGFVDSTELDQMMLLLSQMENKLAMVDRQIDIATDMLKFQMGMDINNEIILTDNLDGLLNQAFAANLIDKNFDVKNHIDYQLLSTANHISKLQYSLDKNKYLPSLAVFGSLSYNAQRKDFNFFRKGDDYPWYRTTYWGLSLTVPLWSSGSKYYQLCMDKFTIKKNDVALKQAEQGLLLEVQNARTNFKTYADQYQNEIKNLDLAHRIYKKALLKYKEGVSSSLELTQVHNQYLTAQGNYFSTLLELLNANSKLNKALNNY
jgi:outer membrane protein